MMILQQKRMAWRAQSRSTNNDSLGVGGVAGMVAGGTGGALRPIVATVGVDATITKRIFTCFLSTSPTSRAIRKHSTFGFA